MQKVINVLAVLSFVGTTGIIGKVWLFIGVKMLSLKVSKSVLLKQQQRQSQTHFLVC